MERTALPAPDAQRAPVFHFPWVVAFGIGFIDQPEVIEKILTHFGLGSALPWKASRRRSEGGRRREWGICSYCGRTFTAKHFERHRWNCFYRDPSLATKVSGAEGECPWLRQQPGGSRGPKPWGDKYFPFASFFGRDPLIS